MLERWDDMRFLLAVARAGSYTAAGKQLGVDQTTVTRRIRSLEGELCRPLLERSASGLVLTPAGEVLRLCAETWEAALHDAGRRLPDAEDVVDGVVRVTMPELLAEPLMPALVAQLASQPNLTLELVVSDDLHSIQRREADLAVRVTATPPEHLVAQRIGTLATAVYASKQWDQEDLSEIPWIGWDPSEAPDSQIERARLEHGPGSRYTMHVNSYGALLWALQAGAGATFLPCLTGDGLRGVTRRTQPAIEDRQVWVLSHPELRRSVKIGWVRACLIELLAARAAALIGTPR